MKWNKYPDVKPTEDKQYLIAQDFGYGKPYYSVARYSQNLYKTDRVSFCEYKGQKKSGFYKLDYEWGGYCETVCHYWTEIEPLEVEK